jgi:hypothetical protein
VIDEERVLSDWGTGERVTIKDISQTQSLATLRLGPLITSVVILGPDRIATGHEDGTLVIWQRRRPEWWWGVFWLPEAWFALLSGGALIAIAVSTARKRAVSSTD